ncbi:hypothetical protein U9M48_004397 [Paspalum notatum var. saurae]|uniref:Uncharacterized protein n=1 Tax=Paspalum notatum var. saurae TaxID=547442 RepID=A0AAQ3PT73_PASNO
MDSKAAFLAVGCGVDTRRKKAHAYWQPLILGSDGFVDLLDFLGHARSWKAGRQYGAMIDAGEVG